MIDKQSSKLYPVKWGVPQGSTLGPLLLILYINDLGNCTLVKPRLFADDTCLVHSADTIDNLSKLINQDMVNVSNWMQANRLCINSEKSNLLIMPPKFNSPSTSPEINIFYDGSPITTSKSAKYLGVYIDDELNFKTHIKLLYTKLSRSLGILHKVKNYLPKKSLLYLCFALLQSHLLYCVTLWFPTYQNYTAPISKLQDRAIKLIYHKHAHHYALSSIYKSLNILQLLDLVKLELGLFVYCHFKNMLPTPFNNFFVKLDEHHPVKTRLQATCCNYWIPHYRTSKLQRSIKYQGVKIWNDIPDDIKSSSVRRFNQKLKLYFC